MPLDKSMLFEFLEILNEELQKKITLVAVGGTAMTLLDLKASTIDIDFTISGDDRKEYDRAIAALQPGYKIDVWNDGWVFCNELPSDYLSLSKDIMTFSKLLLKAIDPLDIVITKIGRLSGRDVSDIGECIKKANLSKNQIKERSKHMTYVGREEDYQYNLSFVLKKFYS